MAEPLARTFELLATAANPQAVEVLMAALDTADPQIPLEAATALLRRNSGRGQMELLRRWDELPAALRSAVEGRAARMSATLKQYLKHGDQRLRRNALEFIRRTESYDLVAALIESLESSDPSEEAVADTLRQLVNRLYEHGCRKPSEVLGGAGLPGADAIRQTVLTALDRAIGDFGRLQRGEVIVESILALGAPDHFAVRKVLTQAPAPCRELAGHLLLQSTHPGVMRLVLDFMAKNYPHGKAFEALRDRLDLPFLCHLLRWFPQRLSQVQQRNFRQLESVAWLTTPGLLEAIPLALQASLAAFVSATGLPGEQKLRVQEWLVRHGSPEGRLASAHVLSSLGNRDVEEILFDGLDSDDDHVQAWATGQLRQHHVPHAAALLLERLDSPREAVRNAARAELKSFDVERVIGMIDRLDPTVSLRVGHILRKIDPDSVTKLAAELRHPIRQRRIRAARSSMALGWQSQLIPLLVAMLEDSDPIVRRTGVEVLGTALDDQMRVTLRHLLNDPSPRVRDAVERALAVPATAPKTERGAS